MESGQLKILFRTFDDIRHLDQDGVEFWLGKELYDLLGYSKWEQFIPVIEKAKTSCLNSGGVVDYNFIQIDTNSDETIILDKFSGDIKLTRYACYLISINGDPKKQEIAFAQAYFITQTRRFEVLEQRMEELARLNSREKLIITEKEFNSFAFSRGVDGKGIAMIRSRGDEELFGGCSTREMKKELGISKNKSLSDFLPNVTLKAKDLATAMTTENSKRKDLRGLVPIGKEHVSSNKNVREALVKADIYPENLDFGEDILKIKRRHKREIEELKNKQKKELDQINSGQTKLL